MSFRLLICIIALFIFSLISSVDPFFYVKLCNNASEKYDEFWNSCSPEKFYRHIDKRLHPTNPKISVIVPCYYKHAKHLYQLLSMYEHQTRLPDEVVVSLSESHFLSSMVIQDLKEELWAFPVTLVLCRDRQAPGKNRNNACCYAVGDVFLCQDADDIPHPQRTEVAHYFFSMYDIDHMMHEYIRILASDDMVLFPNYSPFIDIQVLFLCNFEDVFQARRFTNGNVAISRSVFELIQWSDQSQGEDVLFNRNVYQKFERCAVVRAKLHGYREFLSSTARVEAIKKETVFEKTAEQIAQKKYLVKIVKHKNKSKNYDKKYSE